MIKNSFFFLIFFLSLGNSGFMHAQISRSYTNKTKVTVYANIDVKHNGRILKKKDTLWLLLPKTITKKFFHDNDLIFTPHSELSVNYKSSGKTKSEVWTYKDYEGLPSGPVFSSNILGRGTVGKELTYNFYDTIADQHYLILYLRAPVKELKSDKALRDYFSHSTYWINKRDTLILNYDNAPEAIIFNDYVFKKSGNSIIINPSLLRSGLQRILFSYKTGDKFQNPFPTLLIDLESEILYSKDELQYNEQRAQQSLLENYIDGDYLDYYDSNRQQKKDYRQLIRLLSLIVKSYYR